MPPVLELLTKHGLVWITKPTLVPAQDGALLPALTYTLTHAESGHGISATMLLEQAKRDPQGQGSAITYARRYALMAVLGLVADEDDDGNASSRAPRRTREPRKEKTPPAARISREQLKAIADLISDRDPSHERLRLALVSVGVEVPTGTTRLSPFVKKLTSAQASEFLLLLAEGKK